MGSFNEVKTRFKILRKKKMYPFIAGLFCAIAVLGNSYAEPQQRCENGRCHNPDYNGAFYPSWSSWSNGGYYPSRPQDIYPSGSYYPGNSYGYRPYPISQQIRPTYGRRKRSSQEGSGLASRRYSSYGNSYNKAGICPLYGRKKRSPETAIDGIKSRYYSSGYYYGGSSNYYCSSDRDCTGNLKCCYSYGQQQCTYPHYSGGVGIINNGYGR